MVPKFTHPLIKEKIFLDCFDKVTPEQWADLMQNGMDRFWKSVRSGSQEWDYSGFGIAELLIASERDIPGRTLAHIHYSMNPQGKENFVKGFCLAMDRIPFPPNEDTARTIHDYRLMAEWMRGKEIIPHLTKRIEENPAAWRNDKDTYHALLQLAKNFNVSGGEDAKKLMEAITGPENARSLHFAPLHTRGFDGQDKGQAR